MTYSGIVTGTSYRYAVYMYKKKRSRYHDSNLNQIIRGLLQRSENPSGRKLIQHTQLTHDSRIVSSLQLGYSEQLEINYIQTINYIQDSWFLAKVKKCQMLHWRRRCICWAMEIDLIKSTRRRGRETRFRPREHFPPVVNEYRCYSEYDRAIGSISQA